MKLLTERASSSITKDVVDIVTNISYAFLLIDATNKNITSSDSLLKKIKLQSGINRELYKAIKTITDISTTL